MSTGHELEQAVREIRERVLARHPSGERGRFGIPIAELMPLLHARDAAEAKVASIGTVNPRPPGLKNSLIQGWKRFLARLLDWHVREQVEFNRGAINAVQATLEALTEHNRALEAIAGALESTAARLDALEARVNSLGDLNARADALSAEARELADIRHHWHQWRTDWEHKLSLNEIQFLRSAADLGASYQHRVSELESHLRDQIARQHREFEALVARSMDETQKRFWGDFLKVRQEFERLVHSELRSIRQKTFAAAALAAPPAPGEPAPQAPASYDFIRFADRFRGSEEYVRTTLEGYLPLFTGRTDIVDLGCGRGEFLSLLAARGLPAFGVDGDAESIGICRAQGLAVEQAELFTWLDRQPDSSLDGIFCSQVIEHLPPARVPELFQLAGRKLRAGGIVLFETPNPECLAIFASHFYLDPTHQRPVPPQLAVFYLEEAGFGSIEIRRQSPAVDSMPSLASLPAEFREAFFGCLDYAVIGTRL